ncbi:unnamed protein product [Clavelina lepadiformis]|uniref:Uncharacterized protein n=1 Tax=Clavelina lepadiformis TaxID=159417 RepID=A0ABP0G725_CLALP
MGITWTTIRSISSGWERPLPQIFSSRGKMREWHLLSLRVGEILLETNQDQKCWTSFSEYEVAVKKIAMEMRFKQVLTIISSPWSRLSRTTSLHAMMPTSHCALKNI